MTNKKSPEEIENYLGEPLLDEFSSHLLNHRRNSLITSLLIIAMWHYHFDINFGTSSILAIQSSNPHIVFLAIGLIHIYNWLSFVFEASLHTMWLKIKSTGTVLAHVTSGKWTDGHKDHPDDPRQSSLMFWWKSYQDLLPNILNSLKDTKNNIDIIRDEFLRLEGLVKAEGKAFNIGGVFELIKTIQTNQAKYGSELTRFDELIEYFGRVSVSLNRFENFYKNFAIRQLTKYFIWDFLLPASLGAFAAGLWLGLNGYIILPIL